MDCHFGNSLKINEHEIRGKIFRMFVCKIDWLCDIRIFDVLILHGEFHGINILLTKFLRVEYWVWLENDVFNIICEWNLKIKFKIDEQYMVFVRELVVIFENFTFSELIPPNEIIFY